ncbi:MAG: MBL fold metallo-hydrolase [Fimbriimonas sp.]|nr:MBL fold metallo-hydrolase [Fimbriimonas sp.]
MSSRNLAIGGCACVLIGAVVGLLWPRPTRLTFLNVGQGDCAVFETEGVAILIDSGPKDSTSDAGERIVVPRLRQMGVDGVDLILLSHPDMDHIGGTGAIVRAFPEATIAASRYFQHNTQLLEQLRKWGKRPEEVKWLGPELKGSLGEFKIRIECPAIDENQETNDGSMFVSIVDGAASAVFTGDAPVKAEEAMEPIGGWRSEVMKAGHHGSRTATSESWIETVRPEYAILSCGKNNRYGHPHKEVVDRLEADGVKICRTDREGDITFDFLNGRFVRE